MKRHIIQPIILGVGWLALAAAGGEIHVVGAVQDGVGRASDNTIEMDGHSWRHVSAGAQPGGIETGTAGTLVNRPGFLQVIDVRRPGLDTDGDGVPDELDGDNDGDGLGDRAELDGSAFAGYAVTDPNEADTDGDGMSDSAEAEGMYDPNDPNHRLEITDFYNDAGLPRLVWIGKGGGTTNSIWFTDSMDGAFTNLHHSAAFSGGDAPWFKATNTYAWSPGVEPVLFFRVLTGP